MKFVFGRAVNKCQGQLGSAILKSGGAPRPALNSELLPPLPCSPHFSRTPDWRQLQDRTGAQCSPSSSVTFSQRL